MVVGIQDTHGKARSLTLTKTLFIGLPAAT